MSFSFIVEKPEEVNAGVSTITGEMIQWESDGSLEVMHTHTVGGGGVAANATNRLNV